MSLIARRVFVVLAVTSAALGPAVLSANPTYIDIDPDSYAAVAYSPSTGAYYYAYGYGSRASAERAALNGCKQSDARIVCWVNNGFCALAVGDDASTWGVGWSYGDGASNQEAIRYALNECRRRTTGAYILVCLSSDGQYVYRR